MILDAAAGFVTDGVGDMDEEREDALLRMQDYRNAIECEGDLISFDP